jgi:cell wall-associated NlpC family hydrolase
VRRRLLPLSAIAVLAVAAIALVLGSGGDAARAPARASASAAPTPRASDELPARAPRAQVVEPVAGESAATAALPVEETGDQAPDDSAGAAQAPASSTPRSRSKGGTGPTSDAAVSEADVLKNGIALPPIEAPAAVRSIIEAGNYIARTPYLWGGGHGKWLDKGYDCSGSISYALARAGLLNAPQDSGRLMSWGAPGKGKWITIYANPGHVYMVVAGVRFDTSGQRSNGSRWQNSMRPGGGFEARHPAGL